MNRGNLNKVKGIACAGEGGFGKEAGQSIAAGSAQGLAKTVPQCLHQRTKMMRGIRSKLGFGLTGFNIIDGPCMVHIWVRTVSIEECRWRRHGLSD
jgi:hypothetical protein